MAPTALAPEAPVQAVPAAVPAAPTVEKPSPATNNASRIQTGVSPQPAVAALNVPVGTVFDVRLDQAIDTRRNRPGDRFDATLRDAVVVDNRIMIPRGTRFSGHVVDSRASGRLKGHAELSISLDSFQMGGREYEIRTSHVARASGGHKKRNWWIIGGGSGVGSAIGAVAGGPAGALIGAGAGAGAGTAGAVITGKKQVRLPAETLLSFTLREPVAMAN